jgi:hypothetical protein
MLIMMRLLLLIGAVFLTAQPVMACSAMQAELSVSTVSENKGQPCHQMIAGERIQKSGQDQLPSDCPAGNDCSPMLVQAHANANPPALSAGPDQIFAAVAADIPVVVFPPERPALKTGPPAVFDLPLFTPITLKQRLLN